MSIGLLSHCKEKDTAAGKIALGRLRVVIVTVRALIETAVT